MSKTLTTATHCTLGAIRTVDDLTCYEEDAVTDALLDYVNTETDANFSQVANWNDQPGRTIDEVREAMLMTAKKLRNNE